MKGKILAVAVSVILAGLLLAGGVSAVSGQAEYSAQQENATLEKSKVVDGAYYAAGESVTVAGTVKGDVHCVGRDIVVSGIVEGDVLCAGQNVKVTGVVKGDVRVAGQTITIDGRVENSVSAFGETVDIAKSTVIGQDLNGGARVLTVNGKVMRDISFASESVNVLGMVGRNLHTEVERLTINDGSSVGGQVGYTSSKEAVIAEGSVKGEVNYTKRSNDKAATEARSAAVSFLIYMLLAFALIALVVVLVAPRTVNTISTIGQKRLGLTIATGLGLLFVAPVVLFIVGITVIGLPLAILLGLIWLVVCALAGPIAAYYLGRLILRKNSDNAIVSMLVGTAVLAILFIIPILNIFTWIAVMILGTGMIGLYVAEHQKKPNYTVK